LNQRVFACARLHDPEHPLYDEAEGLRNLLNIMEAAPIYMEAPDVFENVIKLAIESTPSYLATMLEQTCPREQFESASAWLQALRMVISGLLRGAERDGEEPDLLLDRSAKVHTPDVINHELAVDERIDAMIDRAVKRLVQTKAMKQILVSTSPRGGDNQQPKKVQTASLRDQEEHSTIKTERADSARAHLRGKRSRMAVATAAAPKAGRPRPGNSAAGR
jgi:hypothetical protein